MIRRISLFVDEFEKHGRTPALGRFAGWLVVLAGAVIICGMMAAGIAAMLEPTLSNALGISVFLAGPILLTSILSGYMLTPLKPAGWAAYGMLLMIVVVGGAIFGALAATAMAMDAILALPIVTRLLDRGSRPQG